MWEWMLLLVSELALLIERLNREKGTDLVLNKK